MTQTPAAFGLYPSTRALHDGAEALRAARFRHTDISVMYSDGRRALQLGEVVEPEPDAVDDASASLTAILTSLSGIGALALAHDGPFMAGGPILSTLIGASDNLPASLRGLGLPEGAIVPFEDRLKKGGLLLSVQCEDQVWVERAREILEKTGAERVV